MTVAFTISAKDQASAQIRKVGDSFGTLGKKASTTGSMMTKAAVAVTGINQAMQLGRAAAAAMGRAYDMTIGKVLALSKETAKLADDVAKTARAFNISAEELQGFRSTAGFAGVAAQQADRAFLNISKSALDASRGLSTAVDLFKMARVEIYDANGQLKTNSELLRDLSSNLKQGIIPAEQEAAISSNLLRDRTGKMILALKAGPEAITENIERLRAWGALMDDDLLSTSENFIDSQQRMSEALQGTKNKISMGVLPAWTAFNNALAETIGKGNQANPILDYMAGPGGPLDKIGQSAIEIGFTLKAIPDVISLVISTSLFAIETAMGAVLGTVARGLESIGRLGSKLPGAAGDYFASFTAGAQALGRGADAIERVAQRNLDVAVSSFRAIESAGLDAADAVKAYQQALLDARSASGGGTTGGGGGGGADFVVPGGTTIPALGSEFGIFGEDPEAFNKYLAGLDRYKSTEATLGSESASVTTEIAQGWDGVAQSIAGATNQLINLAKESTSASTGKVILSLIGTILSTVGSIVGGPVGAGLQAGGSVVGTVSGVVADRGMMPRQSFAGGGFSVSGAHSMAMIGNDELVLDRRGTQGLSQQISLVNKILGGTADGMLRGLGGGRGNGNAAPAEFSLYIDDEPVAVRVERRMADRSRLGLGEFAAAALVTP
jgi:hypothetical protein